MTDAEIHFPRKIAQWVRLAEHDAFASDMVLALQEHGCAVRFSFFGDAGEYQPVSLEVDEALEVPRLKQMMQDAPRNYVAPFRFSMRFSYAIHTHLFFHELTHFYQDRLGLLFTPLVVKGEMPVMLDGDSEVRLMLFLEAWAEVEAIRLAWVFKGNGDDLAWKGALKHRDWKYIALQYEMWRKEGLGEDEACKRLMAFWYEGAHRRYYERRAWKVFGQFLKRVRKQSHVDDVLPYLRRLDKQDLLGMLSDAGLPAYVVAALNGEVGEKWGQAFEDKMVRRSIVSDHGVSAFSQGDIAIGSAAYLKAAN